MKNICNVVTFIVIAIFACTYVACETGDNQENLIINDCKNSIVLCQDWGALKNQVKEVMREYTLDHEDASHLYLSNDLGFIVAYEFKNGKLCTALIMMPSDKVSDSEINVFFSEYTKLGDVDNKTIYTCEAKNTFATYSMEYDDDMKYKTIGLTQNDFTYENKGEINGHEWVDLGLSVKWATCNVGANYPECHGHYYGWGAITPGEMGQFESENVYLFDISGNSEYDVARLNWGGGWRIPTMNEMKELIEDCDWRWKVLNNISGMEIVGPNGNSIFIPASGIAIDDEYIGGLGESGSYWSATSSSSVEYASRLCFSESSHFTCYSKRSMLINIRPVID